ncbi:YnhF family membrane protein [Photorhabdus cinerea]|uniref:YnhF family membrane protein n=1 Tax=Photorhabdus cinerea TaxID=471575 RepID=A0A7X5QC59_9GAMM|nr:YnhF family membrane protein [Photorhabdus cinerea]NHB91694.1 YnhF family membrane protein [Photorhabdus cinerea]
MDTDLKLGLLTVVSTLAMIVIFAALCLIFA